MTGEECDALARSVIAEAGYGDNFGHSLGHGVGLAVHEFPRVGPRSPDVLLKDTRCSPLSRASTSPAGAECA